MISQLVRLILVFLLAVSYSLVSYSLVFIVSLFSSLTLSSSPPLPALPFIILNLYTFSPSLASPHSYLISPFLRLPVCSDSHFLSCSKNVSLFLSLSLHVTAFLSLHIFVYLSFSYCVLYHPFPLCILSSFPFFHSASPSTFLPSLVSFILYFISPFLSVYSVRCH